MRFLTMALLIGLTVSMATSTLAGKKTTLKLATLAPVGTTWDKILKETTAEWNELSEGRVQVKVYAGGVAGDDRDIVRKMRIGQLHAAALTISGLVAIDPACDVFSIPMFYDSYDEFFYVREQITPVLRDRLQEKGFYLVHWGLVGWVHVFTTRSVETVDDLRQIKIFTAIGRPVENDLLRPQGDADRHEVAGTPVAPASIRGAWSAILDGGVFAQAIGRIAQVFGAFVFVITADLLTRLATSDPNDVGLGCRRGTAWIGRDVDGQLTAPERHV